MLAFEEKECGCEERIVQVALTTAVHKRTDMEGRSIEPKG